MYAANDIVLVIDPTGYHDAYMRVVTGNMCTGPDGEPVLYCRQVAEVLDAHCERIGWRQSRYPREPVSLREIARKVGRWPGR